LEILTNQCPETMRNLIYRQQKGHQKLENGNDLGNK